MKKHLIIPILSLVFSLAFAGTASAELKVGTVDMKKIFESYWRTKEAETKMSETRAVLKRDLDERMETRKKLQDAIEKLNDDIKKPELAQAAAQKKMKERDEKIGEWQTMMRELQQYQAEKEKQLADQTLRIRNGIVEEILKVVNEKTASENYDLVFDTSGNSINNVPVVISAKPSYDFTKEIVEKLNATRPKSAPEVPAEKPAEKSFRKTPGKEVEVVNPPSVELTVSELAALVGGQLASGADGSAKISGAAAVAEALPGEVTFFGNASYLAKLRVSKATAALVPIAFAEEVPAVCIRCENPTLAFSKVIEKFTPPLPRFAPGIHPSAVIAPGVRFGAGVSIQPYAVIEEGASVGAGTVIGAHSYVGHGAQIGDDCLFHPRVTVGRSCKIGSRVILHSGAVIGGDGFGFELQAGRQVKIPQIGIVQVDDGVEIGANSTVDRARFGRTWIGEGTKIDNLVQIGHNVVIGKHCILCAFVGVSGSTKLGDYVTLAGQVGTVGHVEIGDGVVVGAQSGVSKTLPAKQIYMGSPAVPAREWKEQVAQIHTLRKLRARVTHLEQLLDEPGKSIPPST